MRRSAVYSQCLAMTYSHGGTALELFGRHIKQSGLWLRSRFGLDTLGPASTCSSQWSRKFHCSPSMLRGRRWKQDEVDLLISMYNGGASAREIAAKLPERNRYSIELKAHKIRMSRLDLLSPRSAPQGVLTPMDYESIKRAKEVNRLTWENIRETMFPQHSINVLTYHYYLEAKGKERFTKGQFSPDEDKQLLELRNARKLPWSEIKKFMPGRRKSSLQSRYARLCPDINLWPRTLRSSCGSMLRHRGWTDDDDKELILLTAKGVKSSVIGDKLGRTPNAVRLRRHQIRKRVTSSAQKKDQAA